MLRLTKQLSEQGRADIICDRCSRHNTSECYCAQCCIDTATERLAAIEDILGEEYDLEELRRWKEQAEVKN